MSTAAINHALQGGAATACFASALIFTRFYVTTKDRFFVFFACGLAALGAQWVALVLGPEPEHAPYVYAFRAAAFGLIVLGILDKNRRP